MCTCVCFSFSFGVVWWFLSCWGFCFVLVYLFQFLKRGLFDECAQPAAGGNGRYNNLEHYSGYILKKNNGDFPTICQEVTVLRSFFYSVF